MIKAMNVQNIFSPTVIVIRFAKDSREVVGHQNNHLMFKKCG